MSFAFVHLRVHSEYSIADSIIRIPELVAAVAAAGMPAVALTDRGNLFGLVKYYKAALAAGVKPIIGVDVELEAVDTRHGHAPLVLLARNAIGYLNMKRLVTRSYVEGQRNGVPVVKQEWLTVDSAAGLIALSAGKAGALGQY
jgi:DNA polymerase-3 subunit alpha